MIDEHGRIVLAYSGLHAWDAKGNVLASRMAADGKEITLIVDDQDAIYPIVIDPFIQTKKLLASDGEANNWFGGSVAISGDTAIVAAVGDGDKGLSSGSAYIFSRNQGGADNWGEIKNLLQVMELQMNTLEIP